MSNINIREFHQARWNEPVIMELSVPGERGILVPKADKAIIDEVGDSTSKLGKLMRKTPLRLPEVNQPRLVRHYSRVTQECMGSDNTLGISQGTCTLKYNPKINELICGHPGLNDVHPLQDDDTMQGLLEIYYKTEQLMKEIGGMDRFSFSPGGGGHAIYSNAQIVARYHADNGDAHKDEIITTLHSHPVDAAASSTLGYKLITLMPHPETGLPDFEEYQAALSDRTAAIFITNPEDTGIFNNRIEDFTSAAHDVGAVCVYDQANANALIGVARGGDAGFDLMHFNLHKTFATPHGADGPACGAMGVKAKFAKYLPKPWIEFDGERYSLNTDGGDSIGYVKKYLGPAAAVLRTYLWCYSIGEEGLRQAATISCLNNQYMTREILDKVPGATLHYNTTATHRMEQTRLSFEELHKRTGIGIHEVNNRLVDYGISELWMSHHPFTVPEPFTPEPCESYNKADIDYYVEVLRRIAVEAESDPEMLRSAPHKAARHYPEQVPTDSSEEGYLNLATTWRAYRKRFQQ